MTTKTEYELKREVEFNGVSIGQDTARVGVKIDRDEIDLETADKFFCNKRVEGEILVGKAVRQQKMFDDDSQPLVKSVFDIKGFSVRTNHITFGITGSRDALDIETLADFAKQSGVIRFDLVGGIPGREEEPDFIPDSPTNARRISGVDQGGQMPISSLERTQLKELLGRDPGTEHSLTASKMETLASQVDISTQGNTVAHFEQMVRERRDWHREIKGFGERWVDRALNALIAFRAKFPMPTDEDLDEEDDEDLFDQEEANEPAEAGETINE